MSETFQVIVNESSEITTLTPASHTLWLQSPTGKNLELQSGVGIVSMGDHTNEFASLRGGQTVTGSESAIQALEYTGVPGADTVRGARIYATISDKTVSTWGTPGNTYDVGLHALNFGGNPALAIITRKFDSTGASVPGDLPLSIISSGLRVRSQSGAYEWYVIDDAGDDEFPDHDFQGTEFNFETPSGVALKVEDNLVTSDVPVKLPSYSVAALPTVVEGAMIYVADATGAHETGSLCFGNTNDWIDTTTGEAVV